MGYLSEYVDGLEEALEADIAQAAEIAKDELRSTSPRRPRGRARYWSGWRVDIEELDRSRVVGGTRARVYNMNKPTLTHLLEYGHDIVRKRNGIKRVIGHAASYPHIGRARESALKYLMQRGW